MPRIELLQGDITACAVDAIVNAANSSLMGGGGVDGAIHRAGGPVYSATDDRSGLLESCHVASLRIADEVGAKSVAFPAISTGVYGYPISEAAPVAIGSVRRARTAVEAVCFVLFESAPYGAFAEALRDAGDG